MQDEKKQNVTDLKKGIRWEVFIPAFFVVAVAAIVGIVDKDALTKASNMFFFWSLDSFGWLGVQRHPHFVPRWQRRWRV